uniref:Expressed protein n=1 Tax=Schizophyllum commune (strain H4-8 / FGSC 9210) TaxID=578458 RepID=D8Q7G6_SCHCM
MFHNLAPLSYLCDGAPVRFLPVQTQDDCVSLFETVEAEAGRRELAPLRIPNAFFIREGFSMEDYVARQICVDFGMDTSQARRMAYLYSTGTTLGDLVPESVAYALSRFYAFRPYSGSPVILVCDTLLGVSWGLRLKDIDAGINVWYRSAICRAGSSRLLMPQRVEASTSSRSPTARSPRVGFASPRRT